MKKLLCLSSFWFLFSFCITAQPITGIRTIRSGGDYTDFGAAIAALNANGVGAGGVTFKVPAGTVFTGSNYLITATGTESDPISFIKDGAGSNPVIKGQGVSGSTSDYFFKISGGDYITFDGIDLQADPAVTDDLLKIEYGIYITNSNAFDGCQNITLKNCTITLEKTESGRQVAVYSRHNISPAHILGSNSYLVFDNIAVRKGKDGIVVEGNPGYPVRSIEIKNCKIGSPSEEIITNYEYGIFIYNGSDINISYNEVQNVVSSGSYMAIYATNSEGYNRIFNNKIHNLFSTKTTPENDVTGIQYLGLPSSVGFIFNNLVYDLDDSQSVEGNTLYYHVTGIMNEGLGQAIISHNTICLSVQNPKTLSVGLWVYGASSIARNNIIADYSVPSTGTGGRVLVLLSNTPKFEYNLLYIDESITGNYAFNSTTFTKFPDLQKGTTKPSPGYYLNNVLADPNFTGPENFMPENPSPASGNGFPDEEVTGSLNGVSRSITNPDIGAYEGDFGIIENHYPPVIKFTPIPNNSDNEIRLQAMIGDSQEDVTSAKLWYRKSGTSLDYTAVNGTKFGWDWEFKFSPATPGDYEYFICAVDASGNAVSNGFMVSGLDASKTGLAVNNPAANPEYVYKFGYKKSTLSGDVTVGESSTYSSLTGTGGLFEAINSSVISGNINAIITSDILETGAFDLKQWNESGAGGYRLTIKPHNATLHTLITLSAGKGIIFTGSDRVTIDGSFSNDNLQHLKFDNSGWNPLRFFSDGTNGSENIIIKYCILTSGTTASGLYISGSNHKDFLMDHITIGKAGAGILLNYVTDAVISNCTIGSSDLANSVTYYGIRSLYSSNVVIEKNTISNISYSLGCAYGIYLSGITGGTCGKNIIKGIRYTGSDQFGATGIYLVTVKKMLVANNSISQLEGRGSGLSYNMINGLYLSGCSELKVYYNSVNLYGSGINTISSSSASAICFDYSTYCEIINNIFSNRIENSVTSTTSYALRNLTPHDKSNVFRNNLYYVGGAGTNRKYIIGAYTFGTSNLKEWQSVENILSDGVDLGSGASEPGFASYSSDNLALTTTSPALRSGIPVSVTDDINGVARNASKPTIGAYESGSPLVNDVCGPVITLSPIQNNASTSFTWSAVITDNGTVANAELNLRTRGSSDSYTVIPGVKQADNITWMFSLSGLTTGLEYEYFVTAEDNNVNWIMNGISAYYSSSPGPVFVRFFKVSDNSITVGSIPASVYISNTQPATITVPFTTTGTYSGNEFIAWLSEPNGSFVPAKREIGRVTANASGTISANIPAGLTSSSNYRIIIESTGPAVSSPQSTAFRIVNDNGSPTVTLTTTSPAITSSPVQVAIAFSEKVTGFTAADLDVINGTVSGFSGTDQYFTATVTPANEGSVIIGVLPNTVADLSSNYNSASNLLEFLYISREAPKTDVSANDLNRYFNTASKSIRISFDQDITGFDISDIDVTNCTKSAFTPDGTYPARIFRFNVTPLSEGEVTVYVPAGSATNGVYPNSPAGNIFIYDITRPAITLSMAGTPDETTGKFTVMVVIDSKTDAFSQGDLNIVNAVADNFKALSSAIYSVDITPSAYGLVTVAAAAGSVADLTGNTNLASNTVSYTFMASGTEKTTIPVLRTYPNPTTGIFYVELPAGDKFYEIMVLDINGKTVMTRSGSGIVSIDLSGYKKGVYFIKTAPDKFNRIVKVIYE